MSRPGTGVVPSCRSTHRGALHTYSMIYGINDPTALRGRGSVLPAGKSLPIEAELGKKFGASRTVMREAVKILSTKGLIGQRPRVGTYVHTEDKWDLLDAEVLTWILDRHFSHSLVREFLEARLGIEPAAAALAAVNATPEDKELLHQKLEDKGRDERLFRSGGRRHRLPRDHPRDQPQPF